MSGDMTCGSTTPHAAHVYDEDWFEGRRLSWLFCVGTDSQRPLSRTCESHERGTL